MEEELVVVVEAGIAALRARLVGEIDPPSPWRAAFQRVSRHVFVPRIIGCEPPDADGRSDGFVLDAEDDQEHWLELVYSDRVLLTVDEGEERRSSSSRPSVMLRFLRLLDVEDGNTVLEIGTGTGYNAALLCERLGDRLVTSVDVDAELVEAARAALASCGYTPTLAAQDGYHGYPPRAPYDRIIATCSVPLIPPAWRDQLAPDGVLVTPLSNNLLVALRQQPDGTLSGRCDRWGAAFMSLRSPGMAHQSPRVQARKLVDVDRRDIPRPPEWMPSRYLRFYADLVAPGLHFSGGDEVDWRLTANDGSWARVAPGDDGHGYTVAQSGPRRLWDEYETAAQEWASLGHPRWDRFGLTVWPDGSQFVWLDSPDSEHRWEL